MGEKKTRRRRRGEPVKSLRGLMPSDPWKICRDLPDVFPPVPSGQESLPVPGPAAGGPPKGNRNAARARLRDPDHTRVLKLLGEQYPKLGKQAEKFQRDLRSLVVGKRGVVEEWEERLVVQAGRWELTALVLDELVGAGKGSIPYYMMAGVKAIEEKIRCIELLRVE